MATLSVKVNTNKRQDVRSIKGIQTLKVGYFDSENAQKAANNELTQYTGVYGGKVQSGVIRPFITTHLEKEKSFIDSSIEKGMAKGELDLSKLGNSLVEKVKSEIYSGNFHVNSDKNIARKKAQGKSLKPLIDDGEMVNATSFRVEES